LDEAEEALRRAAAQTRPECQRVATTVECLPAVKTAAWLRAAPTAESGGAEVQVRRAEE